MGTHLTKVKTSSANRYIGLIKIYTILYIQVSHCFPQDLVGYAQELMDILQRHPTTLHPDMRKVSNHTLDPRQI